jgi:cytochrome c-type biogenesis protein CcmH/NrfG
MASTTLALPLDVEEIQPEGQAASIVPSAGAALSPETKNLFREGIELLGMGEPQEAITRLERVVAAAPDYSDGFVGLGIAYAMDSRVYPALDSFEKAAEADPSNFYAHFKLAQFHFKLRVPKKGYEEAKRALSYAATPNEKRLVAQILKEERAREAKGVTRPTWNKPFSRKWLQAGMVLLVAACLFLVFHAR